jgi:hypothetical protein
MTQKGVLLILITVRPSDVSELHTVSIFKVDVGRVRLVNCCWSSPAQSFLFPCSAGLRTIFHCLTVLGVVPDSSEYRVLERL